MKHVCFAIAAAVLAVTVHAGWTWDSSAQTLTDGTWTFTTTKKTTLNGVQGLVIYGAPTRAAGSTETVIDLTSCPTDETCGLPVVSLSVDMKNVPVTKFIAPDMMSISYFKDSPTIEEVVVSPDLTSIGGDCFNFYKTMSTTKFRKLTPTVFPKCTSVGKDCFAGAKLLEGDFEFPMLTAVNNGKFFICCEKVTSVKLENVETIGVGGNGNGYMFCGCTSMTNFYAPKLSAVGNGQEVWNGCTSLKRFVTSPTLSFPSGIGNSTFKNLTALESMTCTEFKDATSVEQDAFSGFGLACKISLPDATSIGATAFNKSKVSEVYAPKCTSLGKDCCNAAANLTAFTLSGVGTATNGKQFLGVSSMFTLYWNGTEIPTTFGNYFLQPSGGANAKLCCTVEAKEAWLTALGTKYGDPSDNFRTANNFDDNIRAKKDYPGDDVTAAYVNVQNVMNFWLCDWVVVDFYDVTVECPVGVEVAKLAQNGFDVARNSDGTYTVPAAAKLAVTYRTTGFNRFVDGSSEYMVEGIDAAETIPAETCDKKVVALTTHELTLDMAEFAAKNVIGVTLACADAPWMCVTNGMTVSWTLVESAPFTLTYTAAELCRFENGEKTKDVAYADGIAADTVVAAATIPQAAKPEIKWSWDEAGKKISDGNWSFTVAFTTVGDVTGLAISKYLGGEGALDLTNFKTESGATVDVIRVSNKALQGNLLTSLAAPELLTIDASAFQSCSKLLDVRIPKVTSIATYAFCQCSAMTNIVFSSDITEIGSSCFYQDYALANFGSTDWPLLANLGSTSFEGTKLAGDLNVSLAKTIDRCFNSTLITSCTAPSCEVFGDYAFDKCYSLTNLVVKGSKGCFSTLSKAYALRNCSLLSDLWWMGDEAPTSLTDNAIYTGLTSKPMVVHVNSGKDLENWANLCTATATQIKDDPEYVNYQKIPGWADKKFRKTIVGYIGTVTLKDGAFVRCGATSMASGVVSANNGPCWIVNGAWQPDGLIITIK